MSLAEQARELLNKLEAELERAADSVYRQNMVRLRFAARAERLLEALANLGADCTIESSG